MIPNASQTNESAHALRSWPGHMADDVGATYGPIPLATLTATATGLHLTGNLGDFRIPLPLVRKVGRARMYPWFFSGIRIQHACPGMPVSLQFKPMDARASDLLQELRTLGFPVS